MGALEQQMWQVARGLSAQAAQLPPGQLADVGRQTAQVLQTQPPAPGSGALTLAEVERKMIEAAQQLEAGAAGRAPGDVAAVDLPPGLAAAPPGAPPQLSIETSLANGPGPPLEEPDVASEQPLESPVVPFTRAHRAIIAGTAVDHGCTTGQFEQDAASLPGHEQLMTRADIDFVMKVSLNGMAAVGFNSMSQYRAPLPPGAENEEDEVSALSTLSRLKEMLDRDEEDDPDAAAEEGVPPKRQPSAGDAAKPCEEPEAERPRPEPLSEQTVPEEAEAGEAAPASKKSHERKFGSQSYASPAGMRRSLDISGPAAPAGEASDEGAGAGAASATTPTGARAGVARGGGFQCWGAHLFVERAYEMLLDLEGLTAKLSHAATTPEGEASYERLLADRASAVARVSEAFFGDGPAGRARAPEGVTVPMSSVLALRKGRVLMHRLLRCLAPAQAAAKPAPPVAGPAPEGGQAHGGAPPVAAPRPTSPRSAPAVGVLWRLVAALVRERGSVWGHKAAASAANDDSLQRLQGSLVRSVALAGGRDAPEAPPGGFAAAAATALVATNGGSKVVVAWRSRSGLRLLGHIADACGVERARGGPSVERALSALVAEGCRVFPGLWREITQSGGPAGLEGAGDAPAAPADLWSALAALARAASARQRQRMRSSIGDLVDEALVRTQAGAHIPSDGAGAESQPGGL